MKKLVILCSVLFLFASVTAFKVEDKAEFKFVTETHDFGKIPQGKPVTVDFKFTNIGNEPLIISNIASVCGCTVPKYTNTPILKGQTGTITVTYNAAAMSFFSKGLTITSNSKTPTKVIYIKGEVVAAPVK
ncbi:DUF1573 domain-containing protein [Daejeonella sp.]|jgi:hypothetical protein|uniref:DUF1573 domain-containing protein n=1 Tax=Daejeonella sp. TaxID=2805397 RepID=UPI003783FD92